MYRKKTKIICTLGPSSNSVREITHLTLAGMNVARLNFSHGNYENHAKLIRNIHKVEKLTGKRIGIIQDLQGPKIRIGEMPKEGIKINDNKIFKITIKKIEGYEKNKEIVIPLQYKNIIKDSKKDDTLLINDGIIEAKILKVGKTELTCKVKNGGIIKQGQGIALHPSSISKATITAKDKKDLEFGLKHNVDFVALSFVKSKKDIDDLKKLIKKRKKDTAIIAKIERHEAIKNLKSIIRAVDGVMVARGDLGVDIRPEQVPIVQKLIIALSNKYGKPVITATQVLFSMVKNPTPTRAEVSDAANAVFDHTDAIMLSNETAVGKYPVKATTMLSKISLAVEKELEKHEEELLGFPGPHRSLSAVSSTCLNACDIAKEIKADAIVVYTKEGSIAREIAKHRPFIPIITITESKKVARELTLVWGLNKIFIKIISKKTSDISEKIIQFLKKRKILKKGRKFVLVYNIGRKEKFISTFTI